MNEHHQFEEEIALYGLGVLDGADKAELEGHLYACSACRDKLAASRGTLALLAFAAPAVKPSPIVRERILEAFKARGGGPIRSAPPAPERRGLRMAAWVLVWRQKMTTTASNATAVPAIRKAICLGLRPVNHARMS